MGKKEPEKHKKSVKDKRKRKKKRSSSSSSSNSSSSSSVSLSSIDEETKKKLKAKLKKLLKKEKKKRKEKRTLKKLLKEKVRSEVSNCKRQIEKPKKSEVVCEKYKAFTPITKEEWEKLQNTFKHVYDEETGRTRLVRGTGEIVEECVSREQHLSINKQATRGDGEYFQKKLYQSMK
ncbi:hypothetical protein RUM44_013880 [Polyplax serrata]|uniref:ADP-ribosylation factor-like protein 6-interacting protein 4 n=1 Tax=Polyplax serrata TaxID=468196 RepID=A0ABR1BFP1_POLSC